MSDLQNSIFQLAFNPEQASFSILTQDPNLPDLVNARLGVQFRLNGKQRIGLAYEWDGYKTPQVTTQNCCLGSMQAVSFLLPCHTTGMNYELTFGLLDESPLAVWKVKLTNQSGSSIIVERVTLLEIDPAREGSKVVLPKAQTASQMGFYYNGWQSWSPTGWVAGDGIMPQTHLGGLQAPMIYNHGTPRPKNKGQFSSDFFAVIGDRVSRSGFVLGFLSQLQQFGSISADFNKNMQLSCWANCDDVLVENGKSLETDWAVFNPVLLDHRVPLEKYLSAVASENKVQLPSESPTGWCSWYHFYTKISEPIIKNNLSSILEKQDTLPLQLVQIDDGFESQVGDWFTFKPEFPQGVAPLAQEIHDNGLIPGLWLAPFIVHPKAEIIKQHPNWILRTPDGKPVNGGYVWGALTTALDLTVPEALEYACQVVKTASQEWKFPYLKLDFLYAAALRCKYNDPTQTRAQVLRKGMQAIRDAVGADVTLLGCGAPFGSMLGLVEAMRIGADVSGDWHPHFNGIGLFIKQEPSFPCARNSIRNILTRAALHRQWWVNDPDCLLIRPDTHLSLAEVQSLASVISLTGGSLLVSDDLPKLSAERLRIAECLLPVLNESARVLDWFDAEIPTKLRLDQVNETGEWHLVSKFNWSDQSADLTLSAEDFQLEPCDYFYREFWSGKTGKLNAGQEINFNNVPAHGGIVAAFRQARQNEIQFIGSDLHISQGIEVASWQTTDERVEITLRLPRKASGRITLYSQGGIRRASIENYEVEVKKLGNNLFEIPVEMDGFVFVVIEK